MGALEEALPGLDQHRQVRGAQRGLQRLVGPCMDLVGELEAQRVVGGCRRARGGPTRSRRSGGHAVL